MSALVPAIPAVPPPPRQSSFLRGLRRAILQELEPEILLCERLAVCYAAGYKKSEAARLLDVSTPAITAADKRLKAAADHLDAGDSAPDGW
jgi:hypothetical protein